jgi:hypothetical protein
VKAQFKYVKQVEASLHCMAACILVGGQKSSDYINIRFKPDGAQNARESLEAGSRVGRQTKALADSEPQQSIGWGFRIAERQCQCQGETHIVFMREMIDAALKRKGFWRLLTIGPMRSKLLSMRESS